MLAYYSVAADREFWTEHWGGHTAEELLAVARTSPLTDLIVDALPRTGVVLEAGCGLGQYVLLLRERGWRAVGVDWSAEALAAARRVAAVPLATMAAERAGPAHRRGRRLRLARRGRARSRRSRRHPGRGASRAGAGRRAGDLGAVRERRAPARRARGFAGRAARSRPPAASSTSTRSRAPSCSAALGRHGFRPLAVHPYDPARVLAQAAAAARAVRAGAATARRDRLSAPRRGQRSAPLGAAAGSPVAAGSHASCGVRSTPSRRCACSATCSSSCRRASRQTTRHDLGTL